MTSQIRSNYLSIAKDSIGQQASALTKLANEITNEFEDLINDILNLKGRVILTGMGKSGYIAQKISASLASTGTPSFFIHPAEASHGDLGMITANDMVIMLSNSGETKELFDMINYCKSINIKIAAITMNHESTLALSSDFPLFLPNFKETSSSVAAPTTSALMSLSLGDAIVTSLIEAKKFTKEQFKIFHPGGKIGTSLLKVSDVMHKEKEIPIVSTEDSFANVILTMTQKRLGSTLVVNNADKKLQGIITDGDIRRHIDDNEGLKSLKAKDLMSESANIISQGKFASDALKIMNQFSITILPVLENDKIVGVLHIHDILKHGIGE